MIYIKITEVEMPTDSPEGGDQGARWTVTIVNDEKCTEFILGHFEAQAPLEMESRALRLAERYATTLELPIRQVKRSARDNYKEIKVENS